MWDDVRRPRTPVFAQSRLTSSGVVALRGASSCSVGSWSRLGKASSIP